MINLNKSSFIAISMLITLLLVGCSNYKTSKTPVEEDKNDDEIYSEWLNNRGPETDECMDIMHGESTDTSFVYVYEDSNEEGEWRPIINLPKDAEEYIAKGANVYISFDQWRGKNVRNINVEYNSLYFEPSANWNKTDNYCFDSEGNIIEIYSSLKQLEDNMMLIRSWIYDKDGSILNETKKLTNLGMDRTYNSDEVPFSDKPPYLTTSYQDLVEYLGLPDEVNEGPSLERIDLNEFIENSHYQESEYLQFVSEDKSLVFYYRPDWICKEMAANFRVDCYPKYRMEKIREYGLPEEIVFPEISIVSNECQLDPEKKAGSVILNTSDSEGPKYNTFYKKYNACEVSVDIYSEIDTGEELSKIITE